MKNYKLLFWVLLLFISTKGYSQLNVSNLDLNINPAILNPAMSNNNQTDASLGFRYEGFENKNSFAHVNHPISKKLTLNGGYFGFSTKKNSQDFFYINSNYTTRLGNIDSKLKVSMGVKGSITMITNLKEDFNFGLGFRVYNEKLSFGFSFPLLLKQKYLMTLGGFSTLDESSTWGTASFKTRLFNTEKYSLHYNMSMNFSDGEYEFIKQVYHATASLGFEYKRKNKYEIIGYMRTNDKYGISFNTPIAETMNIGLGYSYTTTDFSELKSNHNLSLYFKYKFIK